MPKRVDHDERKQEIVDAVARIVARGGVAAVTLREVAAEAGVSLGRVQHYFSSKDELLLAASTGNGPPGGGPGTGGRMSGLGPRVSERDRMRATLLDLLPLDQARRTPALLRRSLQATTSGSGGDAGPAPARSQIRTRLEAALAAHELRPDVDVTPETLHLATTVAGLTDDLLDGRITAAQATGAIDYLLNRTFQQAPPGAADRRPPRAEATDPTSDTAMRILRAAERQFAAKGIDGASLREILREAGQSNTGAVQYYFGDRRGLVRAVIARHRGDEEAHRNALLDEYGRTGTTDRRALAHALVAPIAAKLDDPDGGRPYLRVSAEYYLNLPLEENARHPIPDTSIMRWHQQLNELVGPDVLGDPLQLFLPRVLAIRLALIQLSLLASSDAQPDDRLTISYLTDVVTTVLGTGLSPETVALRAGPR